MQVWRVIRESGGRSNLTISPPLLSPSRGGRVCQALTNFLDTENRWWRAEVQQSADVFWRETRSFQQRLVLDPSCSDCFYCFFCWNADEEGGDVKGDHCFVQFQLRFRFCQ